MGGIEDVLCKEWTPEQHQKLQEGVAHYDAGRYATAISILKPLLVELPIPAGNDIAIDAHTHLAFSYFKQGDLERGKRELTFAEQIYKEMVTGHPLAACWRMTVIDFFKENSQFNQLKPPYL